MECMKKNIVLTVTIHGVEDGRNVDFVDSHYDSHAPFIHPSREMIE
jgi:hypothetical protein